MKITITAKKMQIPQNFTEYAEKRLSAKLDKFFGSEAEAKITMATHKNLIVIELTVTYNNLIYRAEQSRKMHWMLPLIKSFVRSERTRPVWKRN